MSARKRVRRKWRGVVGVLIASLCVLLVVLDLEVVPRVMAKMIVAAPNSRVARPLEDGAELGAAAPRVRSFNVRVGPPEAVLSAILYSPAETAAPRGTIVLLHGLGDSKRSLRGTGAYYASRGYRALLVDHRGQGHSTGAYKTFGVRESQDLVTVLDTLAAQDLLALPVGVVGYSYGGAVGIQWAARDPRVQAVVSVSTFSSLREVLPPYTARVAPGVAPWLGRRHFDRALVIAGRMASFAPDDADTARAAAQTKAHILIVHGRDDELIPVAQAERIFAGARDHAELVVQAGDHEMVVADASGEVSRRATRWFERWLTPPTAPAARD